MLATKISEAKFHFLLYNKVFDIISANEVLCSSDRHAIATTIVFFSLQVSVAVKSVKATTAAPAGDAKPAAAAPVKTEAPATSQELTPDITSDNPLETRNLAFYTQKITEGALSFELPTKISCNILI